jgi:hypothetical protein
MSSVEINFSEVCPPYRFCASVTGIMQSYPLLLHITTELRFTIICCFLFPCCRSRLDIEVTIMGVNGRLTREESMSVGFKCFFFVLFHFSYGTWIFFMPLTLWFLLLDLHTSTSKFLGRHLAHRPWDVSLGMLSDQIRSKFAIFIFFIIFSRRILIGTDNGQIRIQTDYIELRI